MTILGVTGGIGSGKSIVCKYLSLHNIPIYDADIEAKRLNNTSPVIRQELIIRFGKSIYINNELDRKQLASLIFNNKENLQFVNQLIHTELAKHFLNWIEDNKRHSILALDAAVLFESGFDKYVDKIITVIAPIDIRINRVSKRDNLSPQQIEARINSQISDEERSKLSDFVVVNDNYESIINQTNIIIKKITRSAL